MAIRVSNGFDVRSKNPIDIRLLLTKAEMAAINDKLMPDTFYFCQCSEDGRIYIYEKNSPVNSETGKFRPYEEVIDLPGAVIASMQTEEGQAAMEAAVSATLPGAITDAMVNPLTKEAMEEAVGKTVPGAIENAMLSETESKRIFEAMFDTKYFEQKLDNKIDLSISVIQSIDSNQ